MCIRVRGGGDGVVVVPTDLPKLPWPSRPRQMREAMDFRLQMVAHTPPSHATIAVVLAP